MLFGILTAKGGGRGEGITIKYGTAEGAAFTVAVYEGLNCSVRAAAVSWARTGIDRAAVSNLLSLLSTIILNGSTRLEARAFTDEVSIGRIVSVISLLASKGNAERSKRS